MTIAQRNALNEMLDAILACECAPDDIRKRAMSLKDKLIWGEMIDRLTR